MTRITTLAAFTVLSGAIMLAFAQQAPSSSSSAPVAGRSSLGVTVTEMETVINGWSAKKNILGKHVLNDQKQRIGTVDDIIVSPSNAVSFAIISTGGFLGIGKHDVAIPIHQIKSTDGDFLLPGGTKEALKALPAFEYTRRK